MRYLTASSIINLTSHTVSIDQFNNGCADNIFREVKKHSTMVVTRNNVAECVLLSPENYISILDELSDAQLIITAYQRLAHYNPRDLLTEKDICQHLGIDENSLNNFDNIDIE